MCPCALVSWDFGLSAPKRAADSGSGAQAQAADGGRRRLLLSGEKQEHSLGAEARCLGQDRGIPGRCSHRILQGLILNRVAS